MAHTLVGINFIYGVPEELPDLGERFAIRSHPREFLQAIGLDGRTYYIARSSTGQPPGHILYRCRPATAEEVAADPAGRIRPGETVIDDEDWIHIGPVHHVPAADGHGGA